MCCGAFSLISCCLGTLTKGMVNEAGVKLKHAVKLSYTMLFFAYCVGIFVLLYYGRNFLGYANYVIKCPQESLDSCLGISSVYRFSFVFVIFHMIILICCLTRDGFAKCVNEGCWMIKA